MTEDDLFGLIDSTMTACGTLSEPGEDHLQPPLDVRRYYRRTVKWNSLPVLGRALSVVAVVRQPLELSLSDTGYKELLIRVSMAASGRFSFWKGAVIGLAVLVLTPEPIGPGDDQVIDRVLSRPLRRYRVVPLGLIRINLGQEAMAFSLRTSPGGLFSECQSLADRLSESLRRFVPPLQF